MSEVLFDFININYSTLLSIWIFFIYVVWFCFTFYNFMMFIAIVHKDVWNITKYLYKKAKLKITQKVLKVAEAVSHLSSGSSSKEPVPTSFPRLSAAMGGRPPRKNDDDDKKKKKKQKEEAKKQKAKEDAAAAANRIWWIKVGIVTLVGVALVGVYVYNKDRINETIATIFTALSSSSSGSSGGANSSGTAQQVFPVSDSSSKYGAVVTPDTMVFSQRALPLAVRNGFPPDVISVCDSTSFITEPTPQKEIHRRLCALMSEYYANLYIADQIQFRDDYANALPYRLTICPEYKVASTEGKAAIITLLLHARPTS